MVCGMEMCGGMLVLGVVAAADMTADQANAQVHPAIPGLQAILAANGAGRNFLDLAEVRAALLLAERLQRSHGVCHLPVVF